MKKHDDKSQNVLLRLLKDTKTIVKWLILCAFISLIAVLLELVGPKLLGEIIDRLYNYWAGVIPELDMSEIVSLCLFLAGAYLLNMLTRLGNMGIMNYVVSSYFTCALRIRISDKIRRMTISYVDKTPNGELISRMMNDVSMLGNTIHNVLEIIISGFIKLIGIAVIVFMINPVMAIPVVLFVPLALFLSAVIANKSKESFREARKLNGEIYALTEEDYSGFETVKAFHLEERQNREHAELCDRQCIVKAKGTFLAGIVQPIISCTNHIAYISICIIGGYFAVKGSIEVGDIVSFVLYAKLFAGPLESIASGLARMQNTLASAKRVYELLDSEEMTPEGDVQADKPVKGKVVFEHVSFSYDKNHPLIQDLNINVEPGQKVAIVGPTGGGKTTIVNLLMRFYDVDEGRILIDGVDAAWMDRAKLRSMFGMVLQDTWLFSGTIYDNIAYGCPDATEEQVHEAAKHVHMDYYIGTLPDGYQTEINEESTNISSGQKQLLTIARAYLANRRMLILDEATSNVDTRTELLIQQTMDELTKGRTSFVIAHRLSTIVDADIILVVRDGRIVEQGSHKELMEQGGFYTEIYNSQYDLLK